MTATDQAAWFGASIGALNFCWNIWLWWRSGPRLRVTAHCNQLNSMGLTGGSLQVRIRVKNNGTAPTTITSVCFQTYDSWWKWVRRKSTDYPAVLSHPQPAELPSKLEVGSEWDARVEQDPNVGDWLESGGIWCAVSHSFAKRPKRVKTLPF